MTDNAGSVLPSTNLKDTAMRYLLTALACLSFSSCAVDPDTEQTEQYNCPQEPVVGDGQPSVLGCNERPKMSDVAKETARQYYAATHPDSAPKAVGCTINTPTQLTCHLHIASLIWPFVAYVGCDVTCTLISTNFSCQVGECHVEVVNPIP